MAVEPLACKIRENKDIEGIELNGINKKLSQYADDLWTAMKHKEKCYKALFSIMSKFAVISGLEVNYNKTEILRVGSLRNTDAMYTTQLPIKWSDGPIKILGVYISGCPVVTRQQNYDKIMAKVELVLKTWSKRQLTLLGKILIVNTLVIPLFVYCLQVVVNLSAEMLSRFQRVISNFLWDGKRSKISFETLIKPYESGGLKLVSLTIKDLAMKAKWAQAARLLLFPQSLWQQIPSYVMGLKNQHIWQVNLTRKEVSKLFGLTLFSSILGSWCHFYFHKPTSRQNVLDQFIWFNSHVKSLRHTLFYKSWYRAGVCYIKDIVDDTGNLLTCEQMIHKYGQSIHILDYVKLIQAIPKEWRVLLKNPLIGVPVKTVLDVVKNAPKVSKILYTYQTDKFVRNTHARSKWEERLNIEISDKRWFEQYNITRKLTPSTALRFFQYRLSNNHLITNVRRNLWDKSISPKCSHGCNENETVMHCLIYCHYAQKIWKALSRWFKYFCFY